MWSRDLNSIARQQGDAAYFVGNFFISGNFCFFFSMLIHVNEVETTTKKQQLTEMKNLLKHNYRCASLCPGSRPSCIF